MAVASSFGRAPNQTIEQVLSYGLGKLRGIRLDQLCSDDFVLADDGRHPYAGISGASRSPDAQARTPKAFACEFGEIDLFVSHSWRA